MNHYPFRLIEKKWQKYWEDNKIFESNNSNNGPKFYVLDMFPYPSGTGLHVGHPLGYIASDIIARYKRHQGYNVLHPMGFDAFGLPAEQYAIQTGQHPTVTTGINTKRYKEQLKNIGLSYDWSREVCTSDPNYYKWTQWIFCKFFNNWYDLNLKKARSITELVEILHLNGNSQIQAACDDDTPKISSDDWNSMDSTVQQKFLLKYRLAFCNTTKVNWCPELGTVLANEEVKGGLSERGGYPVILKQMQQWMLRITAYADRLLSGLTNLDWPICIKEMQQNWIGKSQGAKIYFTVNINGGNQKLSVFTTRPETIFGVTYLAISSNHELLSDIITNEKRQLVNNYLSDLSKTSELELLSNNKHSGVFTGSYALHPFTNKKIPIWIANYVLDGYGTGAVMGVPAHDKRDYAFAIHFDIPINKVIIGENITEPDDKDERILVNSAFIDGLSVKDAKEEVLKRLTKNGTGKDMTTYRIRDAVFSRQRYWGEPIPIYYKDGIPHLLSDDELPLKLPEVEMYKPTSTGLPPLGNAKNWTSHGYPLELNTMPGWAGSSWYYLRYMDCANDKQFVSQTAQSYWKNVDLYIGGSEHTTGHLIYSRFFMMFLYDLGYVSEEEPFKKLINQGMIQGKSSLIYKINGTKTFVSYNLINEYDTLPMYVSIDLAINDVLDIEAFKKWRPEFKDATFVLEDNKFICGSLMEKMSKSKYNVTNPDSIIEKYGADTLRMYTMFLGPLEQSKPWDTNGIDGVFKFFMKLWRLFYNGKKQFSVLHENPSHDTLVILHKTIKKIDYALQNYSFNTAISAFMICVNELSALKCNNNYILQSLVILLSPFSPHISEELWQLLGNTESVTFAKFPTYDAQYLQEDKFEYPITINGKMRTKISFELTTSKEEIKAQILCNNVVCKWIDNKTINKIVIIPNKIINLVTD